jgi:UDP-GlcNAc:undecaprenyl-phosphate GlcNAc-1-phosphate transferase
LSDIHSALRLFIICAAVCGTLSFIVRAISLKLGVLSRPRGDRWGKSATPTLGGIAIVATFVICALLWAVGDSQVYWIVAAGLVVFAFGFADDILHLSVGAKVTGQIISACILIYGGVYVNIYFPFLGIPLSLLWFVGMTNALNLLDNMDGLAAGIAAISSCVLVFHCLGGESARFAPAAAVLSGASVGFLFLNFHPAKLYMGDCGSQFLGLTLAALAVSATWREATSLITLVSVPVLVLCVPIFDTLFVSLHRRSRGLSVAQGGQDHISHRLVALGVSEQVAVTFFWVVSGILGIVSIFAKDYPVLLALASGAAALALILFGVLLGKVKVYPGDAAPPQKGVVIKYLVEHRGAVVLIVLDIIAFFVSYVAAFILRLGDDAFKGVYLLALTQSLPIVLSAKMLSFLYFRLHQNRLERIDAGELFSVLKGVSVGTLIAVATTTMAFRFENLPRKVFIEDWLISLVLVSAIRLLAGKLSRWQSGPPASSSGRCETISGNQ